VIQIIHELVTQKIHFMPIKVGIGFRSKQNLQTDVTIALFGLFAEFEKYLISEPTKEGLAAARSKDQLLGRAKGVSGKSKVDRKEDEIRLLLGKEVSKASIAKIAGVSRTALHHLIATRKLGLKASQRRSWARRP
jgi:DNA invertase Pin-like site-specific DNA recombinase